MKYCPLYHYTVASDRSIDTTGTINDYFPVVYLREIYYERDFHFSHIFPCTTRTSRTKKQKQEKKF